MASEQPGEYDEWRVQADHRDPFWDNLPPYDFTWSKRINPDLCEPDAESAARAHIARHGFQHSCENIRLSRRTVTVGEWSEVD